MRSFITIIIFLLSVVATAQEPTLKGRILKGVVTDSHDKQRLVGASIYLPDLKISTITDKEGCYTIKNLPLIKTTIQVSYLGHQTIIKTIDINIVKELDFELQESNAKMEEVVVTALTGNSLIAHTPFSMSHVSKEELLHKSSSNIIDAIALEPGISQITTGSSISKPVIRGVGYNRVLVVNDGIRQEGQQWGDEHGIEIDGQNVNSVEIIKGAASLIYGSDAMAGVIRFNPAPILSDGDIKANVYTEYQTNNGSLNYSLNVAGNKNTFVWDVRYSDKFAHSYKNKYDNYVFNSGYKERGISSLLGFNKQWGYSHLKLSYYHIEPGIIQGKRDKLTGKFVKSHWENNELSTVLANRDDFKSYGVAVPYQHVNHYKVVSDNNIYLGNGNLKMIIGYQQNQRKEFEDIIHPKDYSLYFKLHTLNYDFRYTLPYLSNSKLVFGVNGMSQSSLNEGHETLLPEYNLFDIGLFGIFSQKIGKLDVSGGIRYDFRRNKVKEFHPHIHDHGHDHGDEEGHDDGNEGDHDHGEESHEHKEYAFPAFSKNYQGLSGSLGLAYQISDKWYAKLNLSRGFRAPNISELSSFGSHGGTVRYEIGNSNLDAENSWQVDLGIGYSSDIVSLNLSLFSNWINNYIFSRKEVDVNGTDSIMGGKKVYKYISGDARLMGGEFSIDFHPNERIHFMNTFSYVNSEQRNQSDSTKYLPFTPAPRWISNLRVDLIKHGKKINNTYISVEMECNLRQSKIYSAHRTETTTPSYTLINLSAGTDIYYHGKKRASVIFIANNIFDKAYQNHLSRLKYTDTNEITGRQGIFNMGRNFGIKVLVPLSF